MRNLKRALSLGMTAAMISGLVVTTGAVSYPDVSSSDNLEAIEVLQMAGVMAGDENGKFNPQQNVTRAEMAVVMCNLLGLRVADYENASIPFTDVPQWAHKYVAACYAEGITGGTSATTYGSNAGVTTAQAALMLMKALGYFQYNGDFGSDWQLATVNQASKIELFDGIDAGATAALTRNEVAQLALNTLEATMVEATGSEGVQIGDITVGSTIKYEEIYKADNSKKQYSAFGDTAVEGKYAVQLGEDLYDGDLKKDTDTDDFGREGNIWSYKDSKGVTTESAVYVDSADYTIVVSKADKDVAYWAEQANKKLEIAGDATITENGVTTLTASTDLKIGDVVEFRDVEDNKASVVTVISYDADVIEEIDTDVTDDDADDGVTAYVTFKNAGTFNNTDIAGYNEDTYVEDAVIGLVEKTVDGDNKVIASYATTSVKGAITAYTDTTYTMGGTKYTMSGNVDDEIVKVDFEDGNYKLYLDPNGYVVKTEIVEGSVTLNDVFYLADIADGNVYWADKETVKGKTTWTYYVQAVYMDGTVEDIQVAQTSSDMTEVEKYLNAMEAGFYTDTKVEKGDTKVSLSAWDDSDYDITAHKADIKTDDDKKVGGAYINKDTKYVVVESYDDSDDLKVTVKTGTISYKYDVADVVKVISKTVDNSPVAQYVVIATESFSAAETGDYIYIVDFDTYVADGLKYTAYDKDGKKISVVVDEDEAVDEDTTGLFTYAVNDDGIYTDLKGENTNFKTGKFVSYYGNLLTVSGLEADLDATDAVIVDVHDTDDYSKSVTTLSAMYTAADKGYTVSLTLVVNSDDEVEYIVVTDVVK